jgi:hypothetical protein
VLIQFKISSSPPPPEKGVHVHVREEKLLWEAWVSIIRDVKEPLRAQMKSLAVTTLSASKMRLACSIVYETTW